MTDRDTNKPLISDLPPSGLAEDILGAFPESAGDPETIEPKSPSNSVAEQPQGDEVMMQIVVFSAGGEEYGFPIFQVVEIVRVSAITRVPNAKDHVKGVFNLRGKIIPVVDLKQRLGLNEVELTKASRIIIVEREAKLLGLLVDEVFQILKIPVSEIEPPPQDLAHGRRRLVVGVAKPEAGGLVFLLDLEETLTASPTADGSGQEGER